MSKFGRSGTGFYDFDSMRIIRIFNVRADITGNDQTPETDVEVLVVTVRTGMIIYRLK